MNVRPKKKASMTFRLTRELEDAIERAAVKNECTPCEIVHDVLEREILKSGEIVSRKIEV